MGDIRQLRQVFDESWDWSTRGDEWSTWWGGTPSLWYGALLPRIHSFVPTGTILEIAPGYGRWTQYLKDLCDRLVLVDLSPKCIDACRERFAAAPHLQFHVTDGRSLPTGLDGQVDLVFSWDSLVHADADIVADYVHELGRVLTADGVGFLHHSNAGAHALAHRIAARAPERIRRPLVRRGALLDVYAWRSTTMSADDVPAMAAAAGLRVVAQEVFSWEHGRYLTETISVIARAGSRWDRPLRRVANRSFRRDAQRTATLYAATGFGG